MATAYFATADEDVVQGKKGKKKELKEVCMFLVIPQSTPLPESDSWELLKGVTAESH